MKGKRLRNKNFFFLGFQQDLNTDLQVQEKMKNRITFNSIQRGFQCALNDINQQAFQNIRFFILDHLICKKAPQMTKRQIHLNIWGELSFKKKKTLLEFFCQPHNQSNTCQVKVFTQYKYQAVILFSLFFLFVLLSRLSLPSFSTDKN